jgi:hypothetical protein
MAVITLESILDLLKQLLETLYDQRNDATKWDAAIEEPGKPRRNVKLDSVSLELAAFEFHVDDDGKKTVLKAEPDLSSLRKMKIEVNGVADPDAAIVYRPVPSPGNAGRFHLDFKRVTLKGEDVRFDFAYPKG